MKIIPIILCRGGSKSVPRKNIRDLAGKPLLSYALTEALKVFPKVYLSTEDTEIAEVGVRFRATTLVRPQKYAQDESKSIDTVKYHLRGLRELEGDFEAILLINACTPFCTSTKIKEIVIMAEEIKDYDSITTLVEDFSAHPSKTCNLIGNKIYPLSPSYDFKTGERQKLVPTYKRNTCLYLSKIKTIKNGSFFGKNNYGLVMNQEESLDINSKFDFLIAELYMKHINDKKEL